MTGRKDDRDLSLDDAVDFELADPGTGDGERAGPVEGVGRPRSLARRQESAAQSALRPRTGLVQVMPSDTHAYLPSANPRTTACVRCGRPYGDRIHDFPGAA